MHAQHADEQEWRNCELGRRIYASEMQRTSAWDARSTLGTLLIVGIIIGLFTVGFPKTVGILIAIILGAARARGL